MLFETLKYSNYVVVTNRKEDSQTLLKNNAKRGADKKKIAQCINEFLRDRLKR